VNDRSDAGVGQPGRDESVLAALRKHVPACVTVLEEEIASLAGALLPAEAALVAHAVDQRRREFTAGRVLARRAFESLGLRHVELAADPDGVPAWPPGFIGCITHGSGRVAVAAAPLTAVQGLGIDMEAVARFHRGLEHHLLSASEIRLQLAAGGEAERQARTAVLFCAKEAWFKCQFPLTRKRLGFTDVEIELDWATGRFAVFPRAGGRTDAGVSGWSTVQGGIARAVIVLEAGRLSAAGRSAWQLPAGR
jgi:4'-phosphopantetheinyl transferase EntD